MNWTNKKSKKEFMEWRFKKYSPDQNPSIAHTEKEIFYSKHFDFQKGVYEAYLRSLGYESIETFKNKDHYRVDIMRDHGVTKGEGKTVEEAFMNMMEQVPNEP